MGAPVVGRSPFPFVHGREKRRRAEPDAGRYTFRRDPAHLPTGAEKGIPVFVTPYYLSLLNPTGKGYDDAAIRSYVIYSSRLVETFGCIRAWEREDIVEEGKPNVAGWLLPAGITSTAVIPKWPS